MRPRQGTTNARRASRARPNINAIMSQEPAPFHTAPAAGAPASARAGGGFRWVICTLLFFSVALNYIDRNILGILKPYLGEKLGWSENDYGTIAAGFNFAYAFGYLAGGRLIQRFGIRRGLPFFVGLWSLAAMAHGLCGFIPAEAIFRLGTFAIPVTALGFLCARIALGLAEGGNFPGAIKAVAEWHPQKERALATGLFNAGTNFGAVICPVVVPWLLARVGWETTFYITGGLGFVWVVAWWLIYEPLEKKHRAAVAEEKHQATPWRELAKYRAVRAYIIAGIIAGPVWSFYQFFLPDFLHKRYGLELQEIGIWTGVFYALGAGGGVFFGWLAGKFLERGWTINAARKTALLICAIAVMPVAFAPYVSVIWLTVLIAGIAGFAHQGWSANLFSFVSDTVPEKAISTVVGLGGFVTYFTGGIMSKLIGWQLEATGSYVPVFCVASLVYVLSLGVIHALVPRIPQSPGAG